MTRKCYSVSKSAIEENNDSVSKSWIVFRHGIVVKFTSAVENSTAEDLAILYTFTVPISIKPIIITTTIES